MEWGEKEKINEWGIKWKPLSLPSFLPLDISDAHRKLSLPFCLFMMDGAFMPHLDSFQFKSCVNLMISACVKQAMGSGLDLSSSARIFLLLSFTYFFVWCDICWFHWVIQLLWSLMCMFSRLKWPSCTMFRLLNLQICLSWQNNFSFHLPFLSLLGYKCFNHKPLSVCYRSNAKRERKIMSGV